MDTGNVWPPTDTSNQYTPVGVTLPYNGNEAIPPPLPATTLQLKTVTNAHRAATAPAAEREPHTAIAPQPRHAVRHTHFTSNVTTSDLCIWVNPAR